MSNQLKLFRELPIGALYRREPEFEAPLHIKVEDTKARTPSNGIQVVHPDVLVFTGAPTQILTWRKIAGSYTDELLTSEYDNWLDSLAQTPDWAEINGE